MFKCTYCKCFKIGRKRYFEEKVICKECLKIVPVWTIQIREKLEKIKKST